MAGARTGVGEGLPAGEEHPIAYTELVAHLAMAIPNFLILEYVRQEPYRDRTMRDAWTVRNGYLEVPDRPGLVYLT